VRTTDFFNELRNALENLYSSGEASAMARMLREARITANELPETLPDHLENRLNEDRERLLKGEPLQYLLGESWFYGNRFHVGTGVLIPRPETEELVDWMLKDLDPSASKRILDIGTGSGCIAVTLKKYRPSAWVSAIDISETALSFARRNAEALHTEIEIRLSDIGDRNSWQDLPDYDLIVSNPPYIPVNEAQLLHCNVTEYEPHTALFVPENDPLFFYRLIAAFAEKKATPTGSIYLEVHQHFAEETRVLFLNQWKDVELKKDMSGNWRMLRATRFR
jgi:release factor glutamine methyltransferase